MAHFAELDNNNNVIDVLKVENSVILDENNKESEALGIAFLKNLFGPNTNWVQTSFNSSFRKNYAAIGALYDPKRDAFLYHQPYPSWTLNENTCQYEPPLPHPDLNHSGEGYIWDWDETLYQSDNNKGWVKNRLS